MALLVPLRNRGEQLRSFVPFMHALLSTQNVTHTIVVAEQEDDDLPFNRGQLLNAAYQYVKENVDYVCYHDVDTLPSASVCYCEPKGPTHLAVASEKNDFKLPYTTYLGGVLMMRATDVEVLNGWSNAYWGWGGEDDDMAIRITRALLPLHRPDARAGRFRSMEHPEEARKPSAHNREHLAGAFNGSKSRWGDGLDSLRATILEEHRDYDHVRLLVRVGDARP